MPSTFSETGKILHVNFSDHFPNDAIIPQPPPGFLWGYHLGGWDTTIQLIRERDKRNFEHDDSLLQRNNFGVRSLYLPNGRKLFGVLPKLPSQNFWILAESKTGVIAYPVPPSKLKVMIKTLGLKRLPNEAKRLNPVLIRNNSATKNTRLK